MPHDLSLLPDHDESCPLLSINYRVCPSLTNKNQIPHKYGMISFLAKYLCIFLSARFRGASAGLSGRAPW